MPDLLDELGTKAAAGKSTAKAKAEPKNSEDEKSKAIKKANAPHATDLVGTVSKVVSDEGEVEGDKLVSSSTTDASDEDSFKDWTKDQIAEALKEARAESAKRRVEAKDLEQRLKSDYDQKVKQIEEKFTPLLQKAEELDKVKAAEADRKRTLEDKVAHRETLIAQRDEELKAIREEAQAIKVELEGKVQQLKANLEAHESFYTEQLDKEKAEIPKKYQDLVETMIKGANDSKHALELIRTAKRENLFGEKKVFVNHSVPNAKTGARTDSASAQQEKRESMKSSEKIREGLKSAIPAMAANKRTFGL